MFKKMFKYEIIVPNVYQNKLLEKIKNVKKIKVYELKIEKEFIFFYTYNYPHGLIFDDTIVINLHHLKIKKFIKNYIITMFGILLLFGALYLTNITITEVKFMQDDYYNQEVEDFVISKLNSYQIIKNKKFMYLDSNINNINKELRSTFYKYQWIGLEKRGTIIYINIAKTTNIEEQENEDQTPGSLYSKYDCLVKGYYVEKGKILVKNNMSVKKGDELISGHLMMYDQSLFDTKAMGYVLGEVSEYVEIEIPRTETTISRSGRIQIIRQFIWFGKEKDIKSKFDSYDTEIETVRKFGNFLEIRNIYLYEIEETSIVWSLEDAIDYGKKKIQNDFINNKKYSPEKIIDILYINNSSDSETFHLRYLVSSIKDVTEFIPFT